jgi:hypothetical protein
MTNEINKISIRDSLKDSIGLGASWITPADSAAVALAFRLARLIDSIFDSGEDLDKLAPIIGRFDALIRELKLTPLSRDKATANTEEVQDGSKYAENYLRLVNPTNSKPKTTRAKSRTSSK